MSDKTEPATADAPRPRFLLDTDILSLVLRGEPRVARHVNSTPGHFIATSIITVEEMLQGRLAQVRRAKEASQMQFQGQYIDLSAVHHPSTDSEW